MLKKIFKHRLFKRKKGKEGVGETTTQEKELEVLQELHKTLEEDFPSLRNILQDQKQLEDLRNAPKSAISFFTSYDEEEYANANRSIGDENSALGIKESDIGVDSGLMSPTDDFYSEMSTFSDDYCGLDKVLRSKMADKMVRRLEDGPIITQCNTPQLPQKRYEQNVDLPMELINLNVTPELRRFYDNMMRKAAAQQNLGRRHNNGKDKEATLIAQKNERNVTSTAGLAADERDTSDPRTNGNEEPRQSCFDAISCDNQKDPEAAATRKPIRQSKIMSKFTRKLSHKQPQQETLSEESSNNMANAREPQTQIHPKPDLSLSQQIPLVNNLNDLSKAPAEMDDHESRHILLLDAAEKSKFLTIRGWRSSPIPTGDDSTFGIGADSVMDVEYKTPKNDEELYPGLASPIYSDMSLRAASGDQSGPLKFLSSLKISSKQASESTERHSNASILPRTTSNIRGIPMARTTSLGFGDIRNEEFGNTFVEEGQGPLCLTNGLYEDAIAKLQALLLPQCCSVLMEPRFHVEQSCQTFPQKSGQRWQPTDSSNSTIVYNMNKPELKVHSLGPNHNNPPMQTKLISTEPIKTNPKYTEVKRIQPKLLRPKKEVLKRAQSPLRTRGGQEPETSPFYQTNQNNVQVLDNDTFESLKLIPNGIAATSSETQKPTQTQGPNSSRIEVLDHHAIETDHEEMNLSQDTRSSSKRSSIFALNPISDVLASKMAAESKQTSETNKVPCKNYVSHADIKLFSSSIDADQKGAVSIAIMPASDIVTDKTSVSWKSCSSIKSENSRAVNESKSKSTHSSLNQISTESDGNKMVFNTDSAEREYLPNLLTGNTQLDEHRMNAYGDRDSFDTSRHSHRLQSQESRWNPTDRKQEDSSSKVRLTYDPIGESEKESVRSMSNSSIEKVDDKSQTPSNNSNPPFVEKRNFFGSQSSVTSMKSFQCDKSAKSSIKLQHSRHEASVRDLERVHSSRGDGSKKSQFASNEVRRLSSSVVELRRDDSKHSNLGVGENFSMQSVIPRQLMSVSSAEKNTNNYYDGSSTSDNQRPCQSSAESSRNAMTNESHGGFTSQSCPVAIHQCRSGEESLDVPEFRDDQLLHGPLVRSGKLKPLLFLEVSKDTTNTANAKKYSFNSRREVFETVKEWKKLNGNTDFSPTSGVSLKQRSTLSKASTNTGDDQTSCASKNIPHEHRSLPSSCKSVEIFLPTTKVENYYSSEGMISDKKTRLDAAAKSDYISRSSLRKAQQPSQSEGLAGSYRPRSKSVSSSRSNKNKDDRRSSSTLRGAREQPLAEDTRKTKKPTDPYMSATFFMNADDYDGSTLTSRGQDSRISKLSGDDRDVSTLTMNDSSVVDPWQEITGASRVIVKAINRIESVRSEDTEYESTADQVESALQTLHNYAYSLGIKERELLLLAVNNDGGDDSSSKDAREAFAADLLNFLRRNMDPAELEVRLMQSYDSSDS